MMFLRTWLLGIKSLLLHPMRSLLTVLGIFIGVASVIWLLAIGEGISSEAQRQIEGLGADNIIVRSIKPPSERRPATAAPRPTGLTRDDYRPADRDDSHDRECVCRSARSAASSATATAWSTDAWSAARPSMPR